MRERTGNEPEMKLTRQELEALEANFQMLVQSRELAITILGLLNERIVDLDVIGTILSLIKEFTGSESVGIRLRQGADFPYCFNIGFADEFIKAEDSICARDKQGEIIRAVDGKPILECFCGQVVRGTTDSSRPFFTEGGSFWTNGRSKLLASRYGAEVSRVVRQRFKCHRYESVVLIPLRSGRQIIGLLQLNDSRENRFTPEMVRFLEAIGAITGIVFTRLEAEDELRQAKEKLEERVEQRTSELLAVKLSLEREIQERKIIEQDLLMSQQRLQLAMEASNLGSWDWNLDTDEIYFDQRWSTVFGHVLDESGSAFDAWQNRIHRDDKLKVMKTLKDHLSDPSHYFEAEYRLQTKSGEWLWILDRGKVVEANGDGKPLRMAGIHIDITDRKQMEEELHHTAERFRGIFESARDCIFVKDSSLQYTHVNPSFSKMFELPESDIVGWTDADLYDKRSAEMLKEVDQRVLNGESVEQEQTRVIRKIPRTFLDTKVPMRNSDGRIIGIVGVSMEITDRKRIQAAASLSDCESDSRSSVMRSTLRAALFLPGYPTRPIKHHVAHNPHHIGKDIRCGTRA